MALDSGRHVDNVLEHAWSNATAGELEKESAARLIQQQQRAKAAGILHRLGAVDDVAAVYGLQRTETVTDLDTLLASPERTQAQWDELTAGLVDALAEAELYRLGWQTLCCLPGFGGAVYARRGAE